MTWEEQGSVTPQEPSAPGTQQPAEQMPPPGYPPQGQVPPQGQQPPPGQVPPQEQVPPQGQMPPQGQPPPPPGAQPSPYGAPQGDSWTGQQQPPVPPPPPPGANPYGTPPEPMWQPPPAYPLAPDAYPVNVSYDREAKIARYWGIPVIGQFIRWLVLIPHFIVLFLVAIVVAIQLLVAWIPVLLLGRFPSWGYHWVGGFLGYSQRVSAYAMLMTPEYPPYALETEDYPITVRYDEGVRINRLWGIPIIGHIMRAVVLIPHFIVLWALSILAWFLMLVVWVPVLLLGRQADVIYTIVGGFYRWQLRTVAYLFMMVDRYPPFSLGEDDPRL